MKEGRREREKEREEGRKGHCPVSSNILNKYTGLFRLTFVKMNKYEMTVGQNILKKNSQPPDFPKVTSLMVTH